MTKDAKDKLLAKIRKVMALASSPNKNEAAAAAERVQAMLAEHNLAMTDVESVDDVEEIGVADGGTTSPQPWRTHIARDVAKLYFCKSFWEVPRAGPKKHFYRFIGAKHNATIAVLMFEYLHTTVDRLARKEAHGKPKSNQSSIRVAFRAGATDELCLRLRRRLHEARQGGVVKTESGNTLPALANLYDLTMQKIDEFEKEKVGEIKPQSRRLKVTAAEALEAGRRAGRTISLDQQISGKAGANLLENK